MRTIDADDIIDTYGNHKTRSMIIGDKQYVQAFNDGVDYMVNAICKAPTIESVQRMKCGRWIEYKEQRIMGVMNMIKCSECGDHHIKSAYGNPKYCCECGAKMEDENASD